MTQPPPPSTVCKGSFTWCTTHVHVHVLVIDCSVYCFSATMGVVGGGEGRGGERMSGHGPCGDDDVEIKESPM